MGIEKILFVIILAHERKDIYDMIWKDMIAGKKNSARGKDGICTLICR